MNSENTYASAVSIDVDLDEAIETTLSKLKSEIPEAADLVLAFYSGYEPDELDRCLPSFFEAANTSALVGTSCHAVVNGARELENTRGLAVFACHLPRTEVLSMSLHYRHTSGGAAITGWPPQLAPEWPANSHLLAFADPFSFPMDVLLERFNDDRPGLEISGGMSSGFDSPGQGRIVVNEEVMNSGAAVVRLSGGIHLETIVSQGCRPIGEPLVITDVERNVIKSLGGKRPLDQLEQIFSKLPAREQRALNQGLHLGRVINEYQDQFAYGDFLIRNVTHIDRQSGEIAVGDYMRKGQTIQFHIRDHESASTELQQLLADRKTKSADAALLFTCNGRGTNLFPDQHHDAELVSKAVDGKPVSGFFAGGEIGPVGGKNFVHGYTASVVLFS